MNSNGLNNMLNSGQYTCDALPGWLDISLKLAGKAVLSEVLVVKIACCACIAMR
ncbi:MAG: hypothetical protein GX754_04185 [Clostridiaceae bacterium]|nr:hypothetical protein [Clostridiaceae bacterium]